jgi:GntR family transcriptional repressor for pyruvate dehydrogenase complex
MPGKERAARPEPSATAREACLSLPRRRRFNRRAELDSGDIATSSLQPIQRTPVYEQVVKRLRDFIDVERLEPGDRLMSERELAERLGVSRTSVRQALTALRVLGMVDIRHGDGVYLTRSSAEVIPSLALEVASSEVDHPMIWEVREGIEVQAARLAARRRTDDDVARIAAAVRAMDESVAVGGDGIVADRHFHRAVAEAAHNEMLLQLVDQMSEVMNRTSESSLTRPGRSRISAAAHRRILEAIEARDETEAAERMRLHVMQSAVLLHPDVG